MAAISFGRRAASASWAAIRVSTHWRSISVLSCASINPASSSQPHRDPPLTLPSPLRGEGKTTQDGGPTWTRTKTEPVMSRGLCQLSYGPAVGDHSTDHDSRKLRSFLEREG